MAVDPRVIPAVRGIVCPGFADTPVLTHSFLTRGAARHNPKIASVTLANKNARAFWALLAHGGGHQADYRLVNSMAAWTKAFTSRHRLQNRDSTFSTLIAQACLR